MAQRYEWDSQKEYDKFWHIDREKERRKKAIVIGVLAVSVCLLLIFCGITFRDKLRSLAGKADPSASIVESAPDSIPEYDGLIRIELNGNEPSFTADYIASVNGESYSELDSLGRCGTAVAKIDRNMMPTEERGAIGMIEPSGWNQAKYPGIVDSEPPYLYNRCHLIAYGLTGQNANERNLITGTRYFNVNGMLLFEEKVMQYLDTSDNHVLYRVTPYFKDRELLARGVEIEAYSVEDDGAGICFHVFAYNVQPGVTLDYRTGESRVTE